MTTTATEGPTLANPEQPDRLTRYAAAALASDGNIDTVLAWLRELQTVAQDSSVDSLGMARTLGTIAGSIRSVTGALLQVKPDVRAVPWPELAEVVAETGRPCASPTCDETVYPWTFNGSHCGPDCVCADMAAHGEQWPS